MVNFSGVITIAVPDMHQALAIQKIRQKYENTDFIQDTAH